MAEKSIRFIFVVFLFEWYAVLQQGAHLLLQYYHKSPTISKIPFGVGI
jgi:hypothetical protein